MDDKCKNQDNSFCPVVESAKLIGDTATLLIIKSLIGGEKRYKDIAEYVCMVSDVTLTTRLKELVKNGLIEREQFKEIPPRVEYRLTDKGMLLKKVIDALEEFGEKYFEKSYFFIKH